MGEYYKTFMAEINLPLFLARVVVAISHYTLVLYLHRRQGANVIKLFA
jgi:hypothetical protein